MISKGKAENSGFGGAIISFEDLLTLDLPRRTCHLPWLPEGGLVMVHGSRGVGKTMFQLGLAVALSSGTPFLKWPVAHAVGVLVVDGEMRSDDLRTRTQALMPVQPQAPLNFLSSDLTYHRLQRDLILADDDARDEITHILDADPSIRVIILDNISCLFTGIDEDKKRAWEPINAWMIRLRHRGLSVVLVHHSGKGGQQRGTSGREDALDTVIQLSLPTGHNAQDGCHFELTFTKVRSATGDDVTPLDAKLLQQNGGLEWAWSALEASKVDQVRRLMAEGVTRTGEIAEELGISKGYASRLKRKAEAKQSEQS